MAEQGHPVTENMCIPYLQPGPKRQNTSQNEKAGKMHDDLIIPLSEFDYRTKAHTIFRSPFLVAKNAGPAPTQTPPLNLMLFSKPPTSLEKTAIRISRNQWIDIDSGYEARLALRASIADRNQKPGMVYHCSTQGRTAVEELYIELIVRHLPARYPTIFRRPTDESVVNTVRFKQTGTLPAYTGSLPPLKLLQYISENVEEDFYIFAQGNGSQNSRLAAFISAFPIGFCPNTYAGKSMEEMHGHVPYTDPATNELANSLRPGEFYEEVSWKLVKASDDLYQPNPYKIPNDFLNNPGTDLQVRAEHQVFTRLPLSRAVVVTVKTYTQSIEDIVARGYGADLSAAIRRDQEHYNKKANWVRSLRTWLDAPRETVRFTGQDYEMVDASSSAPATPIIPSTGRKRRL